MSEKATDKKTTELWGWSYGLGERVRVADSHDRAVSLAQGFAGVLYKYDGGRGWVVQSEFTTPYWEDFSEEQAQAMHVAAEKAKKEKRQAGRRMIGELVFWLIVLLVGVNAVMRNVTAVTVQDHLDALFGLVLTGLVGAAGWVMRPTQGR